MSRIAVVILSPSAMPVARKIGDAVGGTVHGYSKRIADADVLFDDVSGHLRTLFSDGELIIAVMAAGAMMRILAPVLEDKHSEPPVVVVSEDGSSAVPLLGGHYGANYLAEMIAETLGGHAAITTAGDLRFGIALDHPPDGYQLANPENAKNVMAALINGEKAQLVGNCDWLSESNLPFDENGKVRLIVTDKNIDPEPLDLVYCPRHLALGIGCERGCDPDEVLVQARRALAEGGYSEIAIGAVVSIDLKADEPAVNDAGNMFGYGARFFDAETLEKETPRLKNPSDVVFAEVGCHGVAEGAALAAVAANGDLVVPKIKSARVTVAIAKATEPFTLVELPGRARGKLHIVGIGPGDELNRSPEAMRMIAHSTDLVGYSLYLDLLGNLVLGKKRHDFDLGAEEARVRHAMELAGEGKSVALVCSGDAGIYAMATLVFELLDKSSISDGARRIGIQTAPGISALQVAAARAGAPLGHDFCTISLSDLLTPWDDIRKRVRAAGEADFVIAFYNPVSRKRRTQLAWARDELLKHRPSNTPVILGANLGREGETTRIVPLGELNIDEVDMLTVVIVGSSQSRTVVTGDGRIWAYTPRGYASKEDSTIKKDAAE